MVKEKIIYMDKDITDFLELDINNADMFSICPDKSTNITSIAPSAVIGRFPSGNIKEKEQIKSMTLSEKTRGKDIMVELKVEFIILAINLGNIVSLTIDNALNMIGKSWICVIIEKKEANDNLVEYHCILSSRICIQKLVSNY